MTEADTQPVEERLPEGVDISTVAKWEAFFQATDYMQQVREVADNYPEKRSITVAYSDLDRFDTDLAFGLLEHADSALSAAAQAMKNLMHNDLRKADVAVRIVKLPRDAHVTIRDLRSCHLGKLVSFDALITKVTQVKADVRTGAFLCKRCGHIVMHPMDGQVYSLPMECYKEQDGCGRSQGSTKFKLLLDQSVTEDVQKAEAQELLESSRGGTSPARMTVWLSDELAGAVQAGQRVVINGIPKTARDSEVPKSTAMDLDFDAVSVEQQGQGFEDIEIAPEEVEMFRRMASQKDHFDKLIASIAPSISGYGMEKTAMLLQQFGGVAKQLDDGSRLRGDIHILLIGDPGVAKSQMLRYMVKLAPRGVYASGKSSSAAGLTCAAVQDTGWGKGNWVLEAGAMVLADEGFLGVDELDKMREEDRSAMHEAMEQQSITKNAAGIHATLNTRCAILGAMNPKDGRFDVDAALIDQLNIPDTLLSRFDAVFSIQDRPNKEKDSDIAGHILAAHRRGGALANRGADGMADILDSTDAITPAYDAELLRRFIAFARRIKPVLTPEAIAMIRSHYVSIRRTGEGDDKAVPITARQLEGYIRFAEASARSRLSKWVKEEDARRAIDIIEYYLNLFAPVYNGVRDVDAAEGRTPKRSRDKKKIVRGIIENYGSEGVDRDKVAEEAEKKGVSKDDAMEIVSKLIKEGEIIEPNPARGILKVVK